MPAVPVKPDVGLEGVATVPPAPPTMLQAPVPVPGVVAAKVAEVPQTVWSDPALAPVGVALNAITTSSVEAVQGALLIVQRKV